MDRDLVRFRNIAVHNHEAIDRRIVHAICHHHLDDFRDFAGAVTEIEQP